MKSLDDLIGERVIGLIPFIDRVKFQELIVRGVESGGIWIESPTMTQVVLEAVKASAAPKTPVFFLPYSQIVFLAQSEDAVSLSEKRLGL